MYCKLARKLTDMYIAIKTMKQTQKRSFKKLDVIVMETLLRCIYVYSRALYLPLHICFKTGQKCAKYNQITENKSSDDFMTLSFVLSLHHFKMFATFISSI